MYIDATNCFVCWCQRKTSERLKLARGSNGDLGLGGTGGGTELLNGLNNLQTLDDGTENGVLSIQPGGLDSADEELGAVGVGASVGHGKDSGSSVLQGEVLISEPIEERKAKITRSLVSQLSEEKKFDPR